MKPKFIVIEGCDFTGKTTIVKQIYDDLIDLYGDIVHITEALGGTEFGKKCRNFLIQNKGKLSNSQEMDKMLESIEDLNEKIISVARKEGIFIVCDRYYHSTLVYQGYVKNEFEIVKEKIKKANLIEPHLTFILDCEDSKILERMKLRNKSNSYDPKTLSEIEKIRDGYLKLGKRENTILIDTTNFTPREISQKIISYILENDR